MCQLTIKRACGDSLASNIQCYGIHYNVPKGKLLEKCQGCPNLKGVSARLKNAGVKQMKLISYKEKKGSYSQGYSMLRDDDQDSWFRAGEFFKPHAKGTPR